MNFINGLRLANWTEQYLKEVLTQERNEKLIVELFLLTEKTSCQHLLMSEY